LIKVFQAYIQKRMIASLNPGNQKAEVPFYMVEFVAKIPVKEIGI